MCGVNFVWLWAGCWLVFGETGIIVLCVVGLALDAFGVIVCWF